MQLGRELVQLLSVDLLILFELRANQGHLRFEILLRHRLRDPTLHAQVLSLQMDNCDRRLFQSGIDLVLKDLHLCLHLAQPFPFVVVHRLSTGMPS